MKTNMWYYVKNAHVVYRMLTGNKQITHANPILAVKVYKRALYILFMNGEMVKALSMFSNRNFQDYVSRNTKYLYGITRKKYQILYNPTTNKDYHYREILFEGEIGKEVPSFIAVNYEKEFKRKFRR